jgi:hypothetical protein
MQWLQLQAAPEKDDCSRPHKPCMLLTLAVSQEATAQIADTV